MTVRILVTGATGRLGKLVTTGLARRGAHVRVLTRRPLVAATLFGGNVEITTGDFSDLESLDRALTGIDRVFLLSPIGKRLAQHQIAVIDATRRSEAQRIVKVSGSDWTIQAPGSSIAGAAHRTAELHLAASGLEHVVLRPSAWMQVSLAGHIAAARRGEALYAPYGDAGVGFVDARDIADVAVNRLLADIVEPGPLVLTGPEALTLADIAAIAGRVLGRRIGVADRRPDNRPVPHVDPFERRAVAEFMELIGAGNATNVTGTVSQILGRPPRTVAGFLAEHLALATA